MTWESARRISEIFPPVEQGSFWDPTLKGMKGIVATYVYFFERDAEDLRSGDDRASGNRHAGLGCSTHLLQ